MEKEVSKGALRARMLRLRKRLSPAARKKRSQAITLRLTRLNEYKKAKSLLVYQTMGSEVDTGALIQKARAQGKKVTLAPLSFNKRLSVKPWGLVVVPGLVFDMRGQRIGYGGGYFDRFLARLKTKRPTTRVVACAYDFQILKKIPEDPWDVAIPLIVTERRVLRSGF